MIAPAASVPIEAHNACTYAHIYLSPHSDDAALSCGGRIYLQAQRDQRPLVITFFSGSPPGMAFSGFAQGQHDKWKLDKDSAMALRRSEDLAALGVLGADTLYLDYLDCIYRLHPITGDPMYASEEGIFGDPDSAEDDLHLALADSVIAVMGPPRASSSLFAPLTAGHHVDHQLMRLAAMELAARGYVVAFYEDYPYAQIPEALDAALDSWAGPGKLVPQLTAIDEQAIQARITATARYASQIQTLFGDLTTMEERIRAYCAGLAGGSGYAERVWLPR